MPRPLLTLAILAGIATTTAPVGTAAAGIWTPVASGTTETITALDYRADKTVFGTVNGKIFTLAGGQRASYPGLSVVDLALNPSGAAAAAVLSNGSVVRSSDGGATWSAPTQLTTYRPSETGCPTTAGGVLAPLTAPPTALAWANDTTAYVTTTLRGSLFRTTNTGTAWNEISRSAGGPCLWDASNVTDVAPVVGSSSVYFIAQGFGKVYFSSDAVASTPAVRREMVNCFDKAPALAVDTAAASRLIAGDGCTGRLSLGFSDDSGTGGDYLQIENDLPTNGQRAVSFVGGTMIWVGNAGDILTSLDGRKAYRQPADGVDATRDWRAVSAYSATNAMVAGLNGALVMTSSANSIPAPAVVPTPTPTPTPTTVAVTPGGRATTTIGGRQLSLQGPTSCVRPGVPFKVTMAMKRATKKGAKKVKLTKVDFYIDKVKVKTDRKAPFVQRLTVASGTPGTTRTLRARGTIKISKGKPRTKSVKVTFAICS